MKALHVTLGFAGSIATAALATAPAEAGTFYTDLASYQKATFGNLLYDFAGLAEEGDYLDSDVGFTVGPATFANGRGGYSFIIDAGYPDVPAYGRDFYSNQNSQDTFITFSAPLTAFALTFGSYFNHGLDVTFTQSDGSSFTTQLPGQFGATSFLGFGSRGGIASIAIHNSQPPVSDEILPITDIIDFSLGRLIVPEPATWAMMLAGFGAVGAAMRRRRICHGIPQAA